MTLFLNRWPCLPWDILWGIRFHHSQKWKPMPRSYLLNLMSQQTCESYEKIFIHFNPIFIFFKLEARIVLHILVIRPFFRWFKENEIWYFIPFFQALFHFQFTNIETKVIIYKKIIKFIIIIIFILNLMHIFIICFYIPWEYFSSDTIKVGEMIDWTSFQNLWCNESVSIA